jgi:hypothetical protein
MQPKYVPAHELRVGDTIEAEPGSHYVLVARGGAP